MNLDDWIARCRAVTGSLASPPYLDAEIPQLEEALPFSRTAVREEPELVQSFPQAAEMQLAHSPGDLGVRLAALYPLRRAALSNLFQGRTHWSSGVTRDEIEIFKHLAGLWVPDKLSNLVELKFELHNMYLVANWDKAEELFSRLALLGLLEPAQIHALRGQFWFLSVFGRQIEYEMSETDLICDWVYSLPNRCCRSPEFDYFTRPELLERGSPRHWVFAAWCTNPRPPERNPGPEAPRLSDDGLLIDSLDDDNDLRGPEMTEERIKELRLQWHRRYRDFEPRVFPTLSDALKERLIKAAEDLRQAEKLSGSLGACYRPMRARAEFAIGNFTEAGEVFEQSLGDRIIFEDSIGEKEDYRWETLFSAAWAYRLAGNHDRAIETMRRGVGTKSALPGTEWWIAKWYSECGKYDEAARALKHESEGPLSTPDSWLLSSVLALVAIAKDEEDRAERFVERLRRNSPEIVRLLKCIVTEQWPRFEKLKPPCQSAWLHAVCQTYVEPVIPQGVAQSFRHAVLDYGWILEYELKTRIFGPFRERVIHDGSLRLKSAEEHRKATTNALLSFIHNKQNGLTLGEMIVVLEASSSPQNDTEDACRRWLGKRFPKVQSCTGTMRTLNREWVRAKHENPSYERSHVVEISSLCKGALGWI